MNFKRFDLDGLDHVLEFGVTHRLLGHAKLNACPFRAQTEPEPVPTGTDRDRCQKQEQQNVEDDRERVALEASSQICFATQFGEER